MWHFGTVDITDEDMQSIQICLQDPPPPAPATLSSATVTSTFTPTRTVGDLSIMSGKEKTPELYKEPLYLKGSTIYNSHFCISLCIAINMPFFILLFSFIT